MDVVHIAHKSENLLLHRLVCSSVNKLILPVPQVQNVHDDLHT